MNLRKHLLVASSHFSVIDCFLDKEEEVLDWFLCLKYLTLTHWLRQSVLSKIYACVWYGYCWSFKKNEIFFLYLKNQLPQSLWNLGLPQKCLEMWKVILQPIFLKFPSFLFLMPISICFTATLLFQYLKWVISLMILVRFFQDLILKQNSLFLS